MPVLQFDQLSEQILFLFDSVWCTLQSDDTNFPMRVKLQDMYFLFADRLNLLEQAVGANDRIN